MLHIYKNLGGDSGITAYQSGEDYLWVVFADGARYLYTDASAGPERIKRMKLLAEQGEGLNTFINKYVRKNYAKKE